MNIIYVLTSSGNDFFSAMTRISIASIRITNPDIIVMVACDQCTEGKLKNVRDPILDEIDKLLVVETLPGEPIYRNRFVKTSLRNHISGSFLFLDSDIILRGDISEVFSYECDLAGARNLSRSGINEQMWIEDYNNIKTMGWKIKNDNYINGGVLYFNDTKKARLVASVWHNKWLDNLNKTKRLRDQTSLNSAIYDVNPNLFILDDKYNAQFKKNTKVVHNALVWHYYSSLKDSNSTEFELLVKKSVNKKKLSIEEVKKIIEAKYPWRCSNFIDSIAAKRITKKGIYEGWEASWLERDNLFSAVARPATKRISKQNFFKIIRYLQANYNKSK